MPAKLKLSMHEKTTTAGTVRRESESDNSFCKSQRQQSRGNRKEEGEGVL